MTMASALGQKAQSLDSPVKGAVMSTVMPGTSGAIIGQKFSIPYGNTAATHHLRATALRTANGEMTWVCIGSAKVASPDVTPIKCAWRWTALTKAATNPVPEHTAVMQSVTRRLSACLMTCKNSKMHSLTGQ